MTDASDRHDLDDPDLIENQLHDRGPDTLDPDADDDQVDSADADAAAAEGDVRGA